LGIGTTTEDLEFERKFFVMENSLQNLQVYQLARELSKKAWLIYSRFDWQTRKIIGNQFIESVDSIGANIAEGYGRFHYLDKIKFYYNARGSFFESAYHWLNLLQERKLITIIQYHDFTQTADLLIPKLNAYINSIYNAKNIK
jgi:four helix bundle protein